MDAHSEELGPVDVVVIAFPKDAPMTGEAIPLFMDLVENGTIRVLDVLFVTKEADGTVAGFNAAGLDQDQVGDFAVFEGASSGMLGDDDVTTAGEGLEPGESAVLIVYENHWAAPFIAAVRRNGGIPVAFQRIPAQDLIEALEAAEVS